MIGYAEDNVAKLFDYYILKDATTNLYFVYSKGRYKLCVTEIEYAMYDATSELYGGIWTNEGLVYTVKYDRATDRMLPLQTKECKK